MRCAKTISITYNDAEEIDRSSARGLSRRRKNANSNDKGDGRNEESVCES